MQAVTRTATIIGVEARDVEVQADVSNGLPTFQIVGLGDTAIQEARERVRSAIRASGFEFPSARVVVNLAPAPLRKHGTGFDLPIALALLTATRQVPPDLLAETNVVGELALDGGVRHTAGMLAHALAARRANRMLLGPEEGRDAAANIEGLEYRAIRRLSQLRTGTAETAPSPAVQPRQDAGAVMPDLAEVAGHEAAKRVLEIAAAGGHNVLFVGPPGSGKTMLARRLAGILPPLTEEERISTALVHSVAGLDEGPALSGIRPFRAPHHTCSVAGLVGGGSPPRPGEASLAHNGVLFLDELPEFAPSALQALRQPLEDRSLTLVRVDGRTVYPAAFTLVAAMNPCPCGFYGDQQRACKCTEAQAAKYRARVGGPLMDRFDLCVRVDRIDPALLLEKGRAAEASGIVRTRVVAARTRRSPVTACASQPSRDVMHLAQLGADAVQYLSEAARAYHLSGRAVTRVMRVARTIADLDASTVIAADHLMEAVGYRSWEAS